MSEIKKVFQKLKAQGDGALIGYVTGGDPEPRFTPVIAEALVKGGVDIVELGGFGYGGGN
jgi:tryptophan synthase alpha chain